MTRQGRGGQALAIAAMGSFIAGTLGRSVIASWGPKVAEFALNSGRPNISACVLFT